MNKPLGIALVVVGAVLVMLGINSSESLGSDISRFFTGTPTDKSMWLLIAGIGAGVTGLFLGLTSGKSGRS